MRRGVLRLVGGVICAVLLTSGDGVAQGAKPSPPDGHARQVSVDLILVLPVQVSYVSPALPVRTGSLDVGARVVQRIVVNVPRSVTSLSITEAGTLRTINGTLKGFLETQKVEW